MFGPPSYGGRYFRHLILLRLVTQAEYSCRMLYRFGVLVSENIALLNFSVNRGQPVSLLALLYLLALEDFHQFRRNIGVVVHHLPFPLFTPVDVRNPPINTYPLVSELRLAPFST